ncbi:acetylxylan esterase [Antribacter gilvus]|uniref:acetylxylan esterase n=1 Tax=Antribacter gilvus TaxID=2304675 RepID=UPI000F7A01CA|nr:acetylxylan esterase [Antribacter gilvus]
MQFDLPIVELAPAAPPATDEPSGFEEFWADAVARSHAADVVPELEPALPGALGLVADGVTVRGVDGHPLLGWLVRPSFAAHGLPVIVEFVGDGAGRGPVNAHTRFAAAGFAHLVVETRGPDDPRDPLNRHVLGDGLLALQAVRAIEGLDPSRTAVIGAGQGAAVAIAVAGVLADIACVVAESPTVGAHRDALVAAARRATTPALFTGNLSAPVWPATDGGAADLVAAWGAHSDEAMAAIAGRLGAPVPHADRVVGIVVEPSAGGTPGVLTDERRPRYLEWVLEHTHQSEYFTPRVLS